MAEEQGNITNRLNAPTIRPLAYPPKFMVAPFMTAVVADGIGMMTAVLISVFIGTSVSVFLIPIGIHISVIVIGMMEPQVDALLWTKMAKFGGVPSANAMQRGRDKHMSIIMAGE